VTSFTIGRDEHGETLAAVVRGRLHLTWTKAKELVASRRVKLAGQTCADLAKRVKTGQRVDIAEPRTSAPPHSKKSHTAPQKAHPPRRVGFQDQIIVRYFDDDILVVDKPPGLTTMRHADEAAEFGKRGRMFLPKTLANLLPPLIDDRLPIIPVHRIDKDTSGLVVFARNAIAEKHLSDQFRGHTVERRYLAIVRGAPNHERIESWLAADRGDGRRGSGPSGKGQRAVTHIKIVERLGPLTLVECRLETGRTHQVRIHLGEMGCPLAGERVYDRPLHGSPLPDPSGAKRFALHAAVIGIKHPATGRLMKWESPLPEDMQEIISRSRTNDV
jgi:23S rRNA pseudouridine1911/1915/1917 synthase